MTQPAPTAPLTVDQGGPLPAPAAVGNFTEDPATGQEVGSPSLLASSPDTIGAGGGLFVPSPSTLPAPYLQNPTSTQPAPPPPPAHHAGGILGAFEHIGHDVMGAVNWGTGDVQHLYRYFHDVVVRHGWMAGLGELAAAAGVGVVAGIATGGIADAALAGVLGAEGAELGVAGTAAAAAAGSAASAGTEFTVGKLAATGAAQLEARVMYRDSWNRTADGATYRDPHAYQAAYKHFLGQGLNEDEARKQAIANTPGVSFGRDIGDLAAGITGGWKPAHDVSGLADALFDFSMTPGYNVAKVAGAARSGEFGARFASGKGVYQLTGKVRDAAVAAARDAGYTSVDVGDLTANALKTVASQNPNVRAMAEWIARNPGESPTEMVSRVTKALPYFQRTSPDFMRKLADATSGEEVLATIARAINNSAFSFQRYGVPTVSLTRKVLGNPGLTRSAFATNLIDNPLTTRKVEEVSADGYGPAKVLTKFGHMVNTITSYTPWTMDEMTQKASNTVFDPLSQDAPRTIRMILRHSMSPQDARDIAARYQLAGTVAEKKTIYNNAILSAFRADGVDENSELFQRFQQALESSDGDLGTYLADGFGGAVKLPDAEGNFISQGLLFRHQGRFVIPDYNEWQREIVQANKGAIARAANSGDQWLYDHITTRVFKRLVLLSFGFATRVSASELIPAALELGPKAIRNGLGSQFMGRYGSWGEWLNKGEYSDEDLLKGVRVRLKSGDPKAPLGTILQSEAVAGGRRIDVQLPDGTVENHKLSDVIPYHRDLKPDRIQRIADEMGVRVTPDEIPHIKAAFGKAMFGFAKALVDKDYQDFALRTLIGHDGWRVPEGLTADHSYLSGSAHSGYGTAQPPHKAVQDIINRLANDPATHVQPWNPKMGLGHRFTAHIAAADPYHPMHWQFAMKEANSDVGMIRMAKKFTAARESGMSMGKSWKAAVDDQTEWLKTSESAHAEAIRQGLRHFDTAGAERLARARMRGLIGLHIGAETRKINEDMIARFGHKDIPTLEELAHTPLAERPIVKGREVTPLQDGMPTKLSMVDRLWNPIHGLVNHLSREPIFVALGTDEYKAFKPLVEAGVMASSEAHMLAETRAMYRMVPLIHNTMLRSQFHEMTRNVWPFFFAQEQAYKRWGYGMFSNPASIVRGSLLLHGFLGGMSSLENSNDGNTYLTMPGVGSLGDLATKAFGMLGLGLQGGVPSTMLGDLISLKSVFPEGVSGGSGTLGGPSVSPVLALPLRELANHWNPAKPLVQNAIGQLAMQEPIEDELIPNATIRRAWDALGVQQTSAWSSTYNYVIQYNAYKSLQLMRQAEKIDVRAGQVDANGVPYSPEQLKPAAAKLMTEAESYFPLPSANAAAQQKAMERMKWQTRILLLTKVAVGAVSPLSPTLEAGEFGLRQEVQNYTQKYGLQEGLQRFLDANPDATPYTVFQSTSAAGTDIPATKDALDWIKANEGLVKSNPQAAAMLLPQKAGAFNSTAYTEELSVGLRQRRSPEDFLNAVYQAEGDKEYIPSLTQYEQMRNSMAGDYAQSNGLAQQWASYVTNLAQRNPIWYTQQQNGEAWNNARQAYNDLARLDREGKLPKNTPAVAQFRQMNESYKTYLNYLNYIRTVGSFGGSAGMTVYQLNNSFNAYLDGLVSADPSAYPLAYSMFRRLVNEAPQ